MKNQNNIFLLKHGIALYDAADEFEKQGKYEKSREIRQHVGEILKALFDFIETPSKELLDKVMIKTINSTSMESRQWLRTIFSECSVKHLEEYLTKPDEDSVPF